MLRILKWCCNNQYVVFCIMAVLVFALTQVLKLPIKFFTKKIKNEKVRTRVNATILLIPFALGLAFEFVYSHYYLHTVFSIVKGLSYGTAGVSLYEVFKRAFNIKSKNPYESKEGEAVLGLVTAIAQDGKVDKKDKSAVKEYLDKVK